MFQTNPSIADLLARASIAELILPSTGLAQMISDRNTQAGYLASTRINATPMAANAIDARFTQIAGGVGVLALAYGALKNVINERNG